MPPERRDGPQPAICQSSLCFQIIRTAYWRLYRFATLRSFLFGEGGGGVSEGNVLECHGNIRNTKKSVVSMPGH